MTSWTCIATSTVAFLPWDDRIRSTSRHASPPAGHAGDPSLCRATRPEISYRLLELLLRRPYLALRSSFLPERVLSGTQPGRRQPGSTRADNKRRQNMTNPDERRGWRRWGAKAALIAGGLIVGGVLAGTLTANAANTTTSAAGSYAVTAPGAPQTDRTVDESKSQRPDEHLLTGDTASGQRVTVEVGKDFKVTALESAPRRP